ncbi:MAG: hypothetical protein J6C37_10900 [Roseburia sp.]|nr:hypothetical protein [Roseburia sp.]
MLKAGVALVDITPEQGLELAGYPHYPRNNTGAHDPLYAACMYLNDGKKEVAMVTLDLLFFSKRHVAKVRSCVESACGIPGNCVMISCSHTHSGPWASGRLDIESLEAGKGQPKEYVESLISKITEIIVKAKAEAFDAKFASGTALCGAESGVGGNRRLPGGPHDPLVSVMAVKDMQDAVRGIFVNYTLHPTFIHEWSTVCTADYPGYLRLQLSELEKDAVVGFSQGASGNQSSRYYRQGESYDEAERVGRILGKAAYTVVEKADWKSDMEIETAQTTVEVPIRNFGTEEELEAQVARDKAVYEDLYAKYGDSKVREEYYLWQNANLKLLGSEDQLGYVKMQKRGINIELLSDEVPAEVQVFRLGDTCIVGVQGEVFVEYALYVKAMAGFGTVIFNELTNGVLPGYLYTPESLVTGGYETDTSMLDVSFGRMFMDAVLDTIEKSSLGK